MSINPLNHNQSLLSPDSNNKNELSRQLLSNIQEDIEQYLECPYWEIANSIFSKITKWVKQFSNINIDDNAYISIRNDRLELISMLQRAFDVELSLVKNADERYIYWSKNFLARSLLCLNVELSEKVIQHLYNWDKLNYHWRVAGITNQYALDQLVKAHVIKCKNEPINYAKPIEYLLDGEFSKDANLVRLVPKQYKDHLPDFFSDLLAGFLGDTAELYPRTLDNEEWELVKSSNKKINYLTNTLSTEWMPAFTREYEFECSSHYFEYKNEYYVFLFCHESRYGDIDYYIAIFNKLLKYLNKGVTCYYFEIYGYADDCRFFFLVDEKKFQEVNQILKLPCVKPDFIQPYQYLFDAQFTTIEARFIKLMKQGYICSALSKESILIPQQGSKSYEFVKEWFFDLVDEMRAQAQEEMDDYLFLNNAIDIRNLYLTIARHIMPFSLNEISHAKPLWQYGDNHIEQLRDRNPSRDEVLNYVFGIEKLSEAFKMP